MKLSPPLCLDRLLIHHLPGQVAACLLLVGLLTACHAPGQGRPPNQQKTPLFLPPTQIGTTADQPDGTGENTSSLADPFAGGNTPIPANQPTAAVQCQDSLAFLKDITIPDGTTVAPDSTLDKRWEVKNTGNCNWAKDYRIRLIAGPELGAPKELALYPARSGSQAVVRIIFKAPKEPGTYRSAWQAFNPQGEPIGDPFFIEVKVEAP
jgi:hypothetical protein